MWYLLLLLVSASADVYTTPQHAAFLRHHLQPVHPVTLPELDSIMQQEWDHLRSKCPSIDSHPKISVDFDGNLNGTNTLAWASQTLYLGFGNTWTTTLLQDLYTPASYDFRIGVNPSVTNGWYTGTDCQGIGYRYDLRTVLRHELLHGLVLGGSLRYNGGWSVGFDFLGTCYPTLFDTKITNGAGDYVVDGCGLLNIDNQPLYLNGVKLYNPYYKADGFSISHHDHPGKLMYYAIDSSTCLDLQHEEAQMLQAFGISCTVGNVTYGSASMAQTSWWALGAVVLCFLFNTHNPT